MDLSKFEEAKKMLSSSVESIAKDHTLMTRSLINSATEFYKAMANVKLMSEGKQPVVFDKPTIEDETMGKPLEPQSPNVQPPRPFMSTVVEPKKEESTEELKQVYENLTHLTEGLETMGKLLYDTQTILYNRICKGNKAQ
jgi:hypothetical protein